MRLELAQARKVAVLAVAEHVRLGGGQHQRIARREVGTGVRPSRRRLERGKGRVAVRAERLGPDLDAARRSRKAVPLVPGVGRFERHVDPLAARAQGIESDSRGSEPLPVARIAISVPESAPEPEALGQRERDPPVVARLAARGHHRRPELDPAVGGLGDLESDPQRLAFPRRVDREHDVGVLGRRVREDVRVHVKVELLERPHPGRGVRVGDQEVGAEGEEGANRVGPAGDDGAVEILGRAPAVLRRTEGAFSKTEGPGALRFGDELASRNVANRYLLELDVAAPAPEAAGQCVEAGDGAVGLGGVGVLSDSRPGVVGDRAGTGEHLGRGPDLRASDTGRRFECLAGERRTPFAPRVEHRAAAYGTFEGLHREVAFERPRRSVERRARRGLRMLRARVPDHEPIRGAAGPEIALAQQSRLGVVHQIRRIGQVPHEIAVVPALLQHHPGHSECERAVGARADPQPQVRLVRGAGPARVDHDELRAPGSGVRHLPCLRDPGGARVVSPQQGAPGVLPVRGADVHPVGVGGRDVLVPVADLGAVAVVRAAERVHQAFDPLDGVRDRGSARGGDGERDGFGARIGCEPAHLPGDGVERFVPGDPDPSGVGVALGAGALHRMEDAVRALHLLGSGLALGAECAASGVGRIALDPRQSAVANHRYAAAPRPAQRTPAGNAGVLHVVFSHRGLPDRLLRAAYQSPGSRKWA